MDKTAFIKFSRLGFGYSSRNLTLAILALGAGSLLGNGCADPFASCESRRTCPPSDAEAGAGDSGGAGGHLGQSGAGGFDGGASGAEAGGAEAGGAGPHEGGAGGQGEEPCQEGERMCRTLGTGELHVCEDGVWVEYDCPDQRVCSLVNALCVPIAAGCEERAPEEAFCEDATRAVCSADLSSVTREPCEAVCDAGSCIPATCGNGEVEPGEECDDGNADPADGCTDACEWGPQQLVLGGSSSCAIFGNRTVKCWGANHVGQLGTGDTENRGDDPNEMGDNLPFIRVGGELGIFEALDISGSRACGIAERVAKPETGPATIRYTYCWGDNSYGALGIRSPEVGPFLEPTGVSGIPFDPTSVTIGNHFACALHNDAVYCWGRGAYGALGNGLTAAHQPPAPRPLDGPTVSLEAGFQHVCALSRSGTVTCWGRGDYGQLGTGTASAFGDHPTEINSPPPAELGPGVVVEQIALGAFHSCALTSAGLKCWGRNQVGQLGYGISGGDADRIGDSLSELGQSLPLVPVTTASDPVVQIRQMHSSSCALMRSGNLKCWGVAYDPDLGNLAQPALVAAIGNIGDAPNELSQLAPIDFGPGVSVRSFDTGDAHGCALLDSGEIKCWGSNHAGQLGLGHTNDVGTNAADLGAALQAVELR